MIALWLNSKHSHITWFWLAIANTARVDKDEYSKVSVPTLYAATSCAISDNVCHILDSASAWRD